MCLSSRVPITCVASTSEDFSAFLRHFAFWPRQIKACAKKEGAGSGGGGERQKKETLARKRHKFEKRPFSTQGLLNS